MTGRREKGEAAPSEADRRLFDEQHPLGWVEHRLAFAPKGTYGGWIARANAVVKVGDSLFLHGGLGPKYADFSLADLNERVRRELREADPDRPPWSRRTPRARSGTAASPRAGPTCSRTWRRSSRVMARSGS